jgi:flavin reductase (DIM6/NTAB) family NADH-FMN oxidoreductase RutF
MVKTSINRDGISEMDKQKRINFINSLGGFKSICLVGSIDLEGKENCAIFSSIVHIGSNPPLFGLISRPAAFDRNTLENILETGFYTLNHINDSFFKQAHQTSARYDKGVSEFEMTGLESEFKNNFLAPFVVASNVQMGLKFIEKIEIPSNGTVLIIGEVLEVFYPENCLLEDGFLDIEKAETITCSGLDSYHKTIRLDRLSYAKPNKELTSLVSID